MGLKLFIYFSSLLCCPLCFQGSPQTWQWECFLLFGNFSFFKTPFPGWSSVSTSFVSFFVFYIFSYLFLKAMGCFSGCLMSSASFQKLFCGIYSAFKCSFDEFMGEKVVSPSYSSAILGPPSRAYVLIIYLWGVANLFFFSFASNFAYLVRINKFWLKVIFFFFSPFFKNFSWRLITLQYCGGFCHTFIRISHGCTCVPHPDPPSPLHSSGSSQCTSPKHPASCIESGLAKAILFINWALIAFPGIPLFKTACRMAGNRTLFFQLTCLSPSQEEGLVWAS